MSRFVELVLALIAILGKLSRATEVALPYGLVAIYEHSQWKLIYQEKLSRMNRKQWQAVLHRLRRRIRRIEARLVRPYESIIINEVQEINYEQYYLSGNIDSIQSWSPLRDTINKFLMIIHYLQWVDEVSFQGRVIATRNDDGEHNYIDNDPDFTFSIGTLSLCPDIPASEEILIAVITLWRYITGNGAYYIGDVTTYQKNNPLVNITMKDFDYWAHIRHIVGCCCDVCRMGQPNCRACLDSGCEYCGYQ
jgi:hypothetical protein